MDKLTIRDINLAGKKVFVRVDFNVTIDEKTGSISDDSRIRAALPTIEYLLNHKARVILGSHLGKAKGEVDESLRMGVVALRLSELTRKTVHTANDCIGPDVEDAVEDMEDGEMLLLENLRFHAEEEGNDPEFAKSLASLAEIYVDDAFGTAHRKHASITGIPQYLPAVAGLLMEKELKYLGGIIEKPEHPFGGITGGAKVSDKVEMLQNMMEKIDFLLVGGGMAATFLKAKSIGVGASRVEEDRIETAKKIMADAEKNNVHLLLPVDVVIAKELSEEAEASTVSIDDVPADGMILDIGPETAEIFKKELSTCKTVFWNGPMGVNEIEQFAGGTNSIAEFLAGLDATIIIGGGSTSDVVNNLGLADKMTFVSTGGGASLKFMGGQKLPGVEALLDKDSEAAKALK